MGYNRTMIKNTFCILNGIGERLEKRLWRQGILTWRDFIEKDAIDLISPERKASFDETLMTADRELEVRNSTYFARTIKRREHWRLYDIFKSEALCLDIETNGFLPNRGGHVTLIGLYDGYDWRYLMAGKNLSAENLRKEISGYKYLITYYGSSFDIPFLQKTFPDVRFEVPHFDLCLAARRLGFKGGLKNLENDLGIVRDHSVQGMNGYDAVRLWEFAKRGSREAIELLIAYNREDTVNLFEIAKRLYSMLRESTGIEEFVNGHS